MPRIRCRYVDCVYLEAGYCSAPAIELDPDEGCLTYTHISDVAEDDTWEDEDLEEIWEEDDDELFLEEDEDEDWVDEEDV